MIRTYSQERLTLLLKYIKNRSLIIERKYKEELCYHIVQSVEKIENKNSRVSKTSNGRRILLPKCTNCKSKKIKIYQKARSKWIIRKLMIKNTTRKIPPLADTLF